MLIKRPDKGAHWYKKDGTAFYTVEKADGSGLRSVTIRDAFKESAYRSVTNVLSILDKPGLDAWKQEQCIVSALTLPKDPAEDLHKFAERVIEDAGVQAKVAAEAGTRIHESAQDWLVHGRIAEVDDLLLAPFRAWVNSNVDLDSGLVMPPESVVLNHQSAYAGRVDMPLRMRDGSICHADVKTQDVKRDAKGNPKPEFYDDWYLQLAAYSRGTFADGSYASPMPWRLMSLVIDRQQPGCYVREWTDPVNPLASSEPAFQAFVAAARVWTYLKRGTPGLDAQAAKKAA